MFTNWLSKETVFHQCPDLRGKFEDQAKVSDRQEKVEGWDQEAISGASILLIGCGGINSVIGQGLVRQGYGEIHCVDPDLVEPSNLNRQFYDQEDIGQVKGHALAGRLAREGFMGTQIHGYGRYASEFFQEQPHVRPDAIISGVDNNGTRREIQEYSRKRNVPLVTVGVARDASGAYVFIQNPNEKLGCLGCFLGAQLKNQPKSSCPGTPAVLDILQCIGGMALYALSSLFMERTRAWNLLKFFPASGTSQPFVLGKDPNCHLCGDKPRRVGK